MKILRFWFPVILYSGIIFIVSSLHKVPTSIKGLHFDKVIHIIEFLPFGLLAARAMGNTIFEGMNVRTLLFCVTVLTFLYGLSDEWHQSFVIGRESSFYDVLADTLGGLIGAGIYVSVRILKLKNST